MDNDIRKHQRKGSWGQHDTTGGHGTISTTIVWAGLA